MESQELKAKCIEIAKQYSTDIESLLVNAQKLWEFICSGEPIDESLDKDNHQGTLQNLDSVLSEQTVSDLKVLVSYFDSRQKVVLSV